MASGDSGHDLAYTALMAAVERSTRVWRVDRDRLESDLRIAVDAIIMLGMDAPSAREEAIEQLNGIITRARAT